MSNTYFDFKSFRITHTKSAMRVNTDGVLLGAWTSVDGLTATDRLLDIGTGTGVIALMLAQRTDALTNPPTIDAVEIDPASATEATENAAASKWNDRISVHCADIQHFTTKHKYKLIVSNPPYFVNSLAAPDAKRNAARHANELTYSALITVVKNLLTPDGQFSVILPAGEQQRLFCTIAAEKQLSLHRLTEVFSLPDTPPKRALMEFHSPPVEGCHSPKANDGVETSTLTIENSDGYTAEYKQLTRDFYIKF